MLQLLHDAGVGWRVMTSMHMEMLSVFEAVVTGLEGAGYHHEPGQARSKFKHEKSAFFDFMQAHDGRLSRRFRPPRFRLLKKLWEQAGRLHWPRRHPSSEFHNASKYFCLCVRACFSHHQVRAKYLRRHGIWQTQCNVLQVRSNPCFNTKYTGDLKCASLTNVFLLS